MRDDFHSPAWPGNRHHLSAALSHGAHKIGSDILAAFETLARRNYDAPWQAARSRTASRPR